MVTKSKPSPLHIFFPFLINTSSSYVLLAEYGKKEYVKFDISYMRHLLEEKKKSLICNSFTFKNQKDELSHLLKLNPPPS